MIPRKPKIKTEHEIVRFWKKYSKRLFDDFTKDVTPEHTKLEFATWKDKEVDYLVTLIDKSFNEVSVKFAHQIKNIKDFGTVDLSSIKKNKEIYAVFKANRDEHIHYFKKYPEYVHEKLTKHLEESKESVTFHGKKIAEAALPIAKALKKTEDIARRHANFIARDQLHKFTGSIHIAQAQFVGSKRYIWRTSQDNRVRPAHEAREGKIYYYSKAPEGGPPGFDYSCRCTAESILDI